LSKVSVVTFLLEKVNVLWIRAYERKRVCVDWLEQVKAGTWNVPVHQEAAKEVYLHTLYHAIE
jgi:hypothetical protein